MMLINLLITIAMTAWLFFILSGSRSWRLYRAVSMRVAGLGWLAMLLISVAVSVLSYVIMPKPKAAKPAAAREMDAPTAEAGKPVAVLAGRMTINELNVLWHGDKSIKSYDTEAR
jgi:uncharacterized membrane protein